MRAVYKLFPRGALNTVRARALTRRPIAGEEPHMTRAAVAAVALLTMPATLPDAPDGARERTEAGEDRRATRADRRELAGAEELLAQFDDAASRRARRALAAVEDDVLQMLDREITEARIDLLRSPGEARRDRRDLVRVKAIRLEFGSLRGRSGPADLERKHGLISELVQMSGRELRADRRELPADRHAGGNDPRH